MKKKPAKGSTENPATVNLREALNEANKRSAESCNTVARDQISELLDGIRFHRKIDRMQLHVLFTKRLEQSIAAARIEADVRNDHRAAELFKIIEGLRYELQRAHRVWAEQIIEARGANNHMETIARAYRPDAGEECR